MKSAARIFGLVLVKSMPTLLVLLISNEATLAQDSNWHHWRGPTSNGIAADSARPPVEWSDVRNVRWTSDIRGIGTSTPIVHGKQIFVLSAEKTDQQPDVVPVNNSLNKTKPDGFVYRFLVTCFEREEGRMLWERTAVAEAPHEGHHPSHTYAGSSPTTDGERLYVSFGSRGIFCFSLKGELLWKQNLGNMHTRYGWGESVTPVVHGTSLIVNWDQEEGSFIACLDTQTGAVKWKTAREGEVTSWNTPLVTEHDGRTIVVCNGTHRVRGYDLSNGKELFSCAGQTVNAIPSPLRHGDSVIAMSGYRGSLAVSIPLDSAGELDGDDSVNWKHSGGTPYVPSPVIHRNRLIFTSGNRDILSVLDADTGTRIGDPMRLSGLGSVYASPVVAGGHLYFLGRDGTCVVLRDSDDGLKVIAMNRIHDATDASPVVIGKQLLLRSHTKLYCFEENPVRKDAF